MFVEVWMNDFFIGLFLPLLESFRFEDEDDI